MTTEFLSVDFHGLGGTVEKQTNTLRSYVMAMEGDFVDGRGAFDREGLSAIASMVNRNPKGLKSRWGHPSLFSDGLGQFLGRTRNARMDTTLNREGRRVAAVRGDLQLDPTSFNTPNGDLGGYLLRLAESDPDALSSSLVIRPVEKERGRGLTPLWYPDKLKASDIVEEGAAVSGLLEDAGTLRSTLSGLLDRAFKDESREALEQFWNEYLCAKYTLPAAETPKLDALKEQLERMAAKFKE
jgi:hypothetical protein